MLLDIFKINQLWEPVYPYLARHIKELYGHNYGKIVEVGPFCGVIYELYKEGIGDSYHIYSFPEGMEKFYIEELKKREIQDRIEVLPSDPSLKDVPNNYADLVIFRGAFFFPLLFQFDLHAIYRIIKLQGIAFAGGGYGKHTPSELIHRIKARSKELNLMIGKIDITMDDLKRYLYDKGFMENTSIITEGGLWLAIKK